MRQALSAAGTRLRGAFAKGGDAARVSRRISCVLVVHIVLGTHANCGTSIRRANTNLSHALPDEAEPLLKRERGSRRDIGRCPPMEEIRVFQPNAREVIRAVVGRDLSGKGEHPRGVDGGIVHHDGR